MGVKVISLHSYRKLNTPLNREVINFESKWDQVINLWDFDIRQKY
jgi:hypothetical protein